MKKKFVKSLSVVLMFLLVLSAFALSACTDKPRTLNDIEKSLVGRWHSVDLRNGGSHYIFHDDGTFELYSPVLVPSGDGHTYKYQGQKTSEGKFQETGESTDNELGHYFYIKVGEIDYAILDSNPKMLVRYSVIKYTDGSSEIILNVDSDGNFRKKEA